MLSEFADVSPSEAARCPPLDAACITAVLSHVDDAATMGAALRVSHLWRSCARNSALPFWAHLSAERFNALHAWSPTDAMTCVTRNGECARAQPRTTRRVSSPPPATRRRRM